MRDVCANDTEEKKTREISLERETRTGPNKKEEEYIVDKSAPAVSSALPKKRRTVMSRLVKEMAPLCSIYDVDSTNLVEEHELGLGDGLSVKLDVVLGDPLYNIRRDQKVIIRRIMCSAQTV